MIFALIAYIILTTAFVVGAFVIGRCTANKVTWTSVEVTKLTPHQDTRYKVLTDGHEKLYFTHEQVNVARERAKSFKSQ